MPVSKAEFDKAIGTARNSAERTQFIGAMLAAETDEEVIVVGGSAVDVYATGRQPSLDIDLVTPVRPATPVIERWGFRRRKGRVWRRTDIATDIDLVGPNYSGSRRRTRIFVTPFGAVRVAGVEDLVVKRLAELKHWPTTPDWREKLVEQVAVLLSEPGIDEDYLLFVANRDDVVDILADFRRARGTVDVRRE